MNIPLVWGSFSNNPEIFVEPYESTERIEIIVFFLQETMLSSIYIYETAKLLRSGNALGKRQSIRRVLENLILVNILVIMLDTTILVLEFANLYNFQISYKAFAYSVKLKLEFTVLNRLVELTAGGREPNAHGHGESSSGSSGGRNNSNASDILENFNRNKSICGGSYHAYARGGRTDSWPQPTPSEVENGNVVMMTTAITVHREKVHDTELRSKSSCEEKSSDDSTSRTSKYRAESGTERSSSQSDLTKIGSI